MACNAICKLCDRLILSQSVNFSEGNLVINIPAGNYQDRTKYCIVITQAIPPETSITAATVITIGDGTAAYPLLDRCCAPVTACSLRTRTRYSTTVQTSATGGVFRLLGRGSCAPNYDLLSIDGTAPTTEGGTTA